MAGIHDSIEYGLNEVREVYGTTVIKGTISNIDGPSNTCTVNTSLYGVINDVPIHYHCEYDTDVNNGFQGFDDGDEVLVVCKDAVHREKHGQAPDCYVVGHTNGIPKGCHPGYILIQMDDYSTVFDSLTLAKAVIADPLDDSPITLPVLTTDAAFQRWLNTKTSLSTSLTYDVVNTGAAPFNLLSVNCGDCNGGSDYDEHSETYPCGSITGLVYANCTTDRPLTAFEQWGCNLPFGGYLGNCDLMYAGYWDCGTAADECDSASDLTCNSFNAQSYRYTKEYVSQNGTGKRYTYLNADSIYYNENECHGGRSKNTESRDSYDIATIGRCPTGDASDWSNWKTIYKAYSLSYRRQNEFHSIYGALHDFDYYAETYMADDWEPCWEPNPSGFPDFYPWYCDFEGTIYGSRTPEFSLWARYVPSGRLMVQLWLVQDTYINATYKNSKIVARQAGWAVEKYAGCSPCYSIQDLSGGTCRCSDITDMNKNCQDNYDECYEGCIDSISLDNRVLEVHAAVKTFDSWDDLNAQNPFDLSRTATFESTFVELYNTAYAATEVGSYTMGILG